MPTGLFFNPSQSCIRCGQYLGFEGGYGALLLSFAYCIQSTAEKMLIVPLRLEGAHLLGRNVA